MPCTLFTLPSETIFAIANYLNSTADYLHFSSSCKQIHQLLDNEHTIAKTLKRVAPYAVESKSVPIGILSAKEAMERIYDRQQAFANSKPASTIVLGSGSSFLYNQGLLAYKKGRLVRILNVHEASATEGVVFSNLIGPQVFGIECKHSIIELCNLQDGLLSVIFRGDTTPIRWRHWLLVVDIHQEKLAQAQARVRLAVDLWIPREVVFIVRNDKRFLCAMSPTGTSVNGRHREWVCKVCDLDNRSPRPTTLQIPGLAIGEIGKGLVFEIFDGYLYAVSTQAPYELDEPEWLSFYTCFQFPLNRPSSTTLKTLRIWRRHHKEGPINDLWTDLKLHKDETTGELFIMEARKEWTGDTSVQRRTWYRQILPSRFPPPEGATYAVGEDVVDDRDDVDQSFTANQNLALSSVSDEDPPYLFAMPPDDEESDQGYSTTSFGLEQWPGHPRLPYNTHPEYPLDACARPTVDSFMLAKSKYRGYNPSAAAFLDLVVDNRQPATHSDWAQQIRLRVGSRREASPLDEDGMIHEHYYNSRNGKVVPDSERRYVDGGIHLWPPADAPAALQDLLNGHAGLIDVRSIRKGCRTHGDITAISDERSIIYLVKESGATEKENGRLILVNFDEHIQFVHEKWVPEFLDLYDRPREANDKDLAGEITMDETPNVINELMAVNNENAGEEDNGNAEEDEESLDIDLAGESDDNSDNSGVIMPADDVNDYFWCEENDEDEPINLEWFSEEMALWIDVQEGFCFV